MVDELDYSRSCSVSVTASSKRSGYVALLKRSRKSERAARVI
jgi:hypothetical protein